SSSADILCQAVQRIRLGRYPAAASRSQAHTQAGDPSSPTARIHLGENCCQNGPGRSRGPAGGPGAAEHGDRAGVNGQLVACVQGGGGGGSGGVVGVDRGLPGRPGAGGGDGEAEGLPPGVDQDEEVVIEQRRAVFGPVGVIGAVQVERDGQGVLVRPVGARHLGACGGEPLQFGCFCAGKETAAAEDRVGLAEGDEPFGVVLQLSVGLGPVEPGDLVVLAVGVVVAALGPAHLIAAEQHRHAEGQQQGGEHGAGLAGAQREDAGVVGGAFGAAVPGVVVAGPVAVVLAVGLVVLVVVGDQVAQGEAVVDGDQVD